MIISNLCYVELIFTTSVQLFRLIHLTDFYKINGSVAKSGQTFTGDTVPTSGEVNLWCSTSQVYPDTDTYM